MAKQTVAGPYRVQPTDTGHELMEMVDGKLVSLRPRRVYDKEKRTSAYRAVVLLNRRWQKEQEHGQRKSSID